MGRPEPGHFVELSCQRRVCLRPADDPMLASKGAIDGFGFGLCFAVAALYLIIPVRIYAK
jgi:hypothetical protein